MSGRVIALLVFLLLPLGARAAADLSGFGFQQRPGNQVPMDVMVRDEANHPARLRDLAHGRPVILALGYFHCPNLCGVVRADLFDALSHSGLRPDQYSLIALSIDPAETSADAASAKREDMARYPLPGAEQAWHYLTGAAGALQEVAAAVGFKDRYDPRLKQFLHPAGLVFLDATGRVSGYLMGVGYSPGDLALGVTRARDGGIAKAATPILLLCFHFDPSTGRYTLAITKVLQLAGLLTVLTVGGMIGLALRRERRH
jgi:protein SCO1